MKIVPIHSMLRIIAVHQIQCGLIHSAKQVPPIVKAIGACIALQ